VGSVVSLGAPSSHTAFTTAVVADKDGRRGECERSRLNGFEIFQRDFF